LSLWSAAWGQSVSQQSPPKSGGDHSSSLVARVPSGVILVKGAWSSASDSTTPLPEGGAVANGAFSDQYFGMTYALPRDWTETYKGPPPSNTGRYVLADLSPADTYKGPARGSILITAQDLFFDPARASDAAGTINYMKDHLQADYKVESLPTQNKIADRSFTVFTYGSPSAQLHWYVLATEIRCHVLEIVMTSRDTKLLDGLIQDMNKMKFSAAAGPAGGGTVPVCIKDYARDENMIARVEPLFTQRRFNPVPVRIIIDKKGKVKHIHFLSAFSDQAKAISDALGQWKFKPYQKNGQPVEVETGIVFGRVRAHYAE
jgi:hypothetical protein